MAELYFFFFCVYSLLSGGDVANTTEPPASWDRLPPAPFYTTSAPWWRTTSAPWWRTTSAPWWRTTSAPWWRSTRAPWWRTTSAPWWRTTQAPWRTTARMFTTAEPDHWQTNDLSGLMFSVNNGGFLKFRSLSVSDITALTVCMRAITENQWMIYDKLDLRFESSGNILITRSDYSDTYKLQVDKHSTDFRAKLFVPVGKVLSPWRSRCFTWDSGSGMAQLWFDGGMSVRKGIARGTMFTGHLQIALPVFQGQLTDLYVWNRVLNTKQLFQYLNQKETPVRGAIVDWRQMEYATGGYVVLEQTYSKWDPAARQQKRKMKDREKKKRN